MIRDARVLRVFCAPEKGLRGVEDQQSKRLKSSMAVRFAVAFVERLAVERRIVFGKAADQLCAAELARFYAREHYLHRVEHTFDARHAVFLVLEPAADVL